MYDVKGGGQSNHDIWSAIGVRNNITPDTNKFYPWLIELTFFNCKIVNLKKIILNSAQLAVKTN